jgi:phosphoglucomutase/phosphomannomutase
MTLPAELSEEAKKNVQAWLDGPYDPDTKNAIREMARDRPDNLENAFYSYLSFGTGGMRGLMGIGPNRMNIYTVRQTTKGLANYVKATCGSKMLRVVIGFDSRKNSQLFALEAARVLAASAIEVYLFKELRPTPLVSFACRHLNAHAAIMITASHNPPEYNGYKVYWGTGGQVLAPHDNGITKEIGKVRQGGIIPVSPEQDPYIHIIGKEIDEAYLEAIRPLALWPDTDKSSLKVLYSCLHGTGGTIVPQALHQVGITKLAFVREQMTPDGSFPSARVPNPEEGEAMRLGKDQMMAEGHDVFLATDPDADRLGVVVRHGNTSYTLTGNQVASIATEWIFRRLTDRSMLPSAPVVVKSLVTTPLVRAIADRFGAACYDVLPGFKYIAQKMDGWVLGPEHFIFGCEESIGYLYGTHVRDKDGVESACVVSEIAWLLKTQGKTLVDALHELWEQYGFYDESLMSCSFAETKAGRDRMTVVMDQLRKDPPSSFDGTPVIAFEDLSVGQFRGGASYRIGEGLPKANVLIFTLEGESKIIVRPSGTEPKIKVYVMMKAPKSMALQEAIDSTTERANNIKINLNKILQ